MSGPQNVKNKNIVINFNYKSIHYPGKRLVFPPNYCWTCHEYLTKQMFWEFRDVREYQFIRRTFIFHGQREKIEYYKFRTSVTAEVNLLHVFVNDLYNKLMKLNIYNKIQRINKYIIK